MAEIRYPDYTDPDMHPAVVDAEYERARAEEDAIDRAYMDDCGCEGGEQCEECAPCCDQALLNDPSSPVCVFCEGR